MSLTADTADAIIAVDAAVAKYERMLDRLRLEVPEASDALADMTPEWAELKDAIVGLQETACGDGLHFNSVKEARAYRNPRPARKFGCGGVHSGEMCNTREVFTRWHFVGLRED